MFIDFHVHAFPDALAGRAMQALRQAGGALRPALDGRIASLEGELARLGGRGVLLPVATKPQQAATINDWAAHCRSDILIPFGSVHPYAPDALAELERVGALGLQGVKLHPEYQQFDPLDPRAIAVYKKCAALGLICVFHAGMDMAYLPPCLLDPRTMARVAAHFDGAPLVAAHMGGYMMWEEALRHLAGLPIHLDTSYSHSRILRPLAEKLIAKHGADRVLFGSDSPWSAIEYERDFIDSLALTEAEREAILRGNAERLLGGQHGFQQEYKGGNTDA